jgi:hypothetical protein
MRTKGRGQSTLLLLDAVDVLQRLHIAYAVIGAYAVSFYGLLRASLDADVVLSSAGVEDTGWKRLTHALSEKGYGVEIRRGGMEDPIRSVIKVTDVFANQVDMLIGIQGMDAKAFERTVSVSFKSKELRIISAEDLIAMKLFAGSPKDMSDAKGLFEVLGESLNRDLLDQLVREYGKTTQKRFESLKR